MSTLFLHPILKFQPLISLAISMGSLSPPHSPWNRANAASSRSFWSSTILPANLVVPSVLWEADCSLVFVSELLSRAISSIFSVELNSYNSDQYRALTGDVTFKPFMLIEILVYCSRCKFKNIIRNNK